MTAEQILQTVIGGMVMQIASLQAEIIRLNAELAKLAPKPE
jgi:uncharacterized small protein (DUF1192 family)